MLAHLPDKEAPNRLRTNQRGLIFLSQLTNQIATFFFFSFRHIITSTPLQKEPVSFPFLSHLFFSHYL